MDAKTYVKNVLITEARDFTPVRQRMELEKNIRLIHACAGISSEIAELIQLSNKSTDSIDRVNLMEECGDILWYVGIASDALDAVTDIGNYRPYAIAEYVKFDDDLSNHLFNAASRLSEMAGELQDIAIKKAIFYGKPVTDDSMIEQLKDIIAEVRGLLEQAGYKIEDARERNISKLKARYGAKFTEAAALERNLEAEREILEKK